MNRRGVQRTFVPYVVLVLSLAITLFFAFVVRRSEQVRNQTRFSGVVADLTNYVRGRPRLYVEALRAGTGLFAVNPSLDPVAFHKFIERLELAEQYPGAQGIGFLARVRRGESDSVGTIGPGPKDAQPSPEETQPEYYKVVYFEPLDQHRNAGLGSDMSSDPVLRAAMEHARDTGLPAASGPITLKGQNAADEGPGFLIYAPFYSHDLTPKTVAERRAALSGFVYAQFRAADLVRALRASRDFGAIDMQIFDGPPQKENLLYDSAAAAGATSPSWREQLKTTATIDVAGRTWSLNLAARPEFYSSGWGVYYITISGLVLSLMLFGYTRSQARARAAAEHSTLELQESEARVRATLSERERAESALRESEERYRKLIENANDIIYTLDFDGNLTSINRAGERLAGYSREELLKMNLGQLLTPDSLATGRAMLDRKHGGGKRTNYEIDICTKDGLLRTLELSSRFVIKNGEAIGVQGIARDISERRRVEEALREADQRALTEYERLLERITNLAQTLGTARDLLTIYCGLREFTVTSVPCDGFFVSLYDPMRNVRTASYGWGDNQEVDVSALPSMPITAAGPNSRAVRTGQIIITDDYMNATRGHPAIVVGPENGLRPQTSMAVPMSVMGRIIGTIEVQSYQRSAYRDEHVTAMRMAANLTAVAIENVRLLERESTARAVAEESNRLKDEFLATVSHELRTPLTAILGWSRMLETGGLDAPIAARALETIRRNARSQSQIIDDILDVSRIITGNLHLDLTPLELTPLIEAAINVVRPTAEAKGIEIEAVYDSQLNLVSGDANRLQQVFWNLLSNAIKFTASGGQVRISTRGSDAHAEIQVSDNGQGISPDFLPFVFDRFRQADSTTTRRHGGLGLGLAITRHLVEIHGGSVKAESPGEGQGATFTVRLPIVSLPAPRRRAVEEQSAVAASIAKDTLALQGLHVLLVDDDIDTLEMISTAFTSLKVRVTAAVSADEAMVRINEARPDVIVSDIAMPGADGYDLLRRVRASKHETAIPAVAITAYAREEDRERALAFGFQDYLSKPIEPAELIAIVSKLTERYQQAGLNGKSE